VVPGSTYSAFGRTLTTNRGQLQFADSPIDNPNLDITASRTIGDVVAGVHVRGTAKSPLLTLYSEPPMDQADILSYLTLGHPMNVAGQGESEELFSAANTAGLIGGNYLAGYVGRQFGLEEVRVEAESATASPWVVVGKYLSPRLYVRYGVGVYEDAYSIIVRYQLTEHWQLQGEGGQFSGADILYTFERP
jgi:translocation and assembly module TamB